MLNVKGKIIVVTNRNINKDETGVELFGDDLNPLGAEQLNMALAEKVSEKWSLELVSNPEIPAYDKPTSLEIFKECLKVDNDNNWVLFVHGYNQSMSKNLEKCAELASYGLNVITFSWPSNPGPQQLWKKLKEYSKAVKNAKRSAIALERLLELMREYVTRYQSDECKLNISMIIHSLGNFLFEEFVRSTTYDNECKIFSNVILHQADANSKKHEHWVSKLTEDTRVYVTINDKDSVLCASDMVNANRLGSSSDNCIMQDVKYFNFTDAKGVGTSHRPWHKPGSSNKGIGDFYTAVLNGKRGENVDCWEYKKAKNFYRLK
jgi:esterase/lipase superfamily enzyme